MTECHGSEQTPELVKPAGADSTIPSAVLSRRAVYGFIPLEVSSMFL
jgi:hypothetical protein